MQQPGALLSHLPHDALKEVLKHLYSTQEVAQSMLVSREWLMVASDPRTWQHYTLCLARSNHQLPQYARKVQVLRPAAVAFAQSLYGMKARELPAVHTLDVGWSDVFVTLGVLAQWEDNERQKGACLEPNEGEKQAGLEENKGQRVAGLEQVERERQAGFGAVLPKDERKRGAGSAEEERDRAAGLGRACPACTSSACIASMPAGPSACTCNGCTACTSSTCTAGIFGAHNACIPGAPCCLPPSPLSASSLPWPPADKLQPHHNQDESELRIAGIKRLAVFSTLQTLDVSGCCFGPLHAQALAGLSNLHTLNASFNGLGAAGLDHLCALSRLHTLDMSVNGLGLERVASVVGLKSLRVLKVGRNQLGKEGAKVLGAMVDLQVLDACGNQFGDEGMHHLMRLTNLHTLNVASNRISQAGSRDLTALTKLRKLDMSHNPLHCEGAACMGQLTGLEQLYAEYVGNEGGGNGFKDLFPLGNLRNLHELKVATYGAVEAVPEWLLQLTALRSLSVRCGSLLDAGFELEVRVRLPGLSQLVFWK